jgi:hypothetical protein
MMKKSATRPPIYKNPALPAAKRVKDLLSRMTLEKNRADDLRPAGKKPGKWWMPMASVAKKGWHAFFVNGKDAWPPSNS